MKKGTTQALLIELNIDVTLATEIIFTIKYSKDGIIQKNYPVDTIIHNEKIYLPFSQAETELFSTEIFIEGQINFTDGSVGKTEIVKKNIETTLFTQIVAGSTPSIENSETVSLALDGDVVLVNGGGGGVFTPIPTTPTENTLLLSWQNDAALPNPEPVTITAPTGAQGAKGDPGVVGERGEKGEAGAQGSRGLQGLKGDTGAPGLQGNKGDKGEQGATGLQGDKGAKGDKGDKGDPGATGAQGLKGEQGLQGVAGLQGAPGEVGAKGDIGTTGLQGATGAQGVKGDTGAQGPKGDIGTTGLQGATGAQGASGAKGDPGAPGAKGDTGTQGVQGIPGATGAPGAKGDTGTPGESYLLTPQDKIDIAAIIGVEFPINTTLAAVLGGGE